MALVEQIRSMSAVVMGYASSNGFCSLYTGRSAFEEAVAAMDHHLADPIDLAPSTAPKSFYSMTGTTRWPVSADRFCNQPAPA
jgi:hypothetical protein